ncbi:MAG TPA: OmpA family protein [Verrucomicrobiae bacterium]|jgi:peptidoglycan-associated lipoprotein|nr:OmpA family protein [Verrucomicrobiae bacterium]
MKSSKICLLTLGFAVALGASGCKSPQNAKTIHGRGAPIGNDVPPSAPMESSTTTTSSNLNATAEPEPVPVVFRDFSNWGHDANTFEAQTIYFAYDTAKIKDTEEGNAQVVAAYLQAHERDAVLVEGNCDERGTEEYNRALGERRALAAREALLALGIAPERVDLISYGEDKPLDPGHDETAWKKNRRAAFVLLTPPQ